jgi:hypothetical protein
MSCDLASFFPFSHAQNRNQRAEASTRSADQPAQPQELEPLLVADGSGEPDSEQVSVECSQHLLSEN